MSSSSSIPAIEFQAAVTRLYNKVHANPALLFYCPRAAVGRCLLALPVNPYTLQFRKDFSEGLAQGRRFTILEGIDILTTYCDGAHLNTAHNDPVIAQAYRDAYMTATMFKFVLEHLSNKGFGSNYFE